MSEAKYLEVAHSLGMRISREALWSDEQCNWIGDFPELIESRWQLTRHLLGPVLYNGASGIALVLAYLFSVTQEKTLRRTAEGALNHVLSQVEQFNPAVTFGFYAGLAGIAHVLIEAGSIFDSEMLVQRGLDLAQDISVSEPPAVQSWDVVSGSAGVIPLLLRIQERYDHPNLLEAAMRHGDSLLRAANESEEGWSWKTFPDPDARNLTGFSHGTAGIAWSLVELHEKSKEERFLKAAREALRYERSWFDPHEDNWPDFRAVEQPDALVYSAAWCHGAPGIGLSRLRVFQLLRDTDCLKDAQAAIRTTTKMLESVIPDGEGNCSLCHGNFGNAELLIFAAEILENAQYLETVYRLADSAAKKHYNGDIPWPCGLNDGETPDLMLGWAGMAHFYLRLFKHSDIPSVLIVGP